jgi:predicted nucleotidyltransferase
MNISIKQKIQSQISKYPEIKLGYYFGSQSKGKGKPLSDHDFAIYLDETTTPSRKFEIIGGITADLMQIMGSNNIDLVLINDTKNIPLTFTIFSQGELIYEVEPYRVLMGSKYMSAYHDFQVFTTKHDYA